MRVASTLRVPDIAELRQLCDNDIQKHMVSMVFLLLIVAQIWLMGLGHAAHEGPENLCPAHHGANMKQPSCVRWVTVFLFVLSLTGLFSRSAAAQTSHLDWATLLVVNLSPENNEYISPTRLTWAGVSGATRYVNHSYCASFLTGLFKQAYGWTDGDLADWLGSSSPNAATYHDAIVQENGFTRIANVGDVRAGDILAILYTRSEEGPTGHIAVVRSAPRRRMATAPLVLSTSQYEVSVVDSSQTPHGTGDTRLRSDGTTDTGAGFGTLRLYVNTSLSIVGHSWSTTSISLYYSMAFRHVVIGRL
jgi:hypothetical protein